MWIGGYDADRRGASGWVQHRSNVGNLAMKDLGNGCIRFVHAVARPDRRQIAVEDMALHPDGGDVADHETGGGARLDEHPRRNQLLHYDAGDGRAHSQFGAYGRALLLRFVEFLFGDLEDLESLQTGLDVGGRVVKGGLRCFHVFLSRCAVVKKLASTDYRPSGEFLLVASLLVGRDSCRD